MQSSELNSNPLDSPGALPAPEAEQKEQATASPSDHQPLVFVVGGTGKQGSAVCRALAAQARWRVRTLSRDPGSQAARALRTLGVEVLQGDFERTDALKTAMSGAYGVFVNLDYWTLGEEKELAIGRLLVELAAELDVKHFVYSSLEHIHRDSGGTLSVPFFDNKARIAEYAVSKGLPCTFVKYSSYYENFLTGYTRLQRDAEGRYVFRFPLGDKPMALVPLQGAGRVVAEVFAHPEQSIGKSIGLAGAHLTGAEMAATFERVVGRPAVFVDIPLEEFAKSNPRPSTDMWVYKREFEPTFARYLADSRAFVPEIEGLDHWLRDWPLDDGITQ